MSNDGDVSALALNLQICLNVLRVHQPDNEAARRALTRFLESIHGAFLHDGECKLTVSGDQVFVNQERVRHLSEVAELRELMEKLEVGGLSFSSPPEPAALARWIVTLARTGTWVADDECYLEALPLGMVSRGGGSSDRRPAEVYRRAIDDVRDMYQEARERGDLSLRRGRRLVADVMETLVTDESVLFGIMTLRDYDLYTFQHSVNVCILASALGTRLGLGRVASRELGVAALFHDVGKTEIPRKILNKPGKFTPQEGEVMKSHPVVGARLLVTKRGLEPGTLRAVQVALEHHIRYDGSGYPRLPLEATPGLFSRVVTVCDCYDAMTSVRAYRQVPIIPSQAMAYIWHERGKGFDPVLIKAFVSMLGAYPPGSLCRLSDETLAVVVEPPRTGSIFRPVVKRWGAEVTIDLTDTPELTITESLDPSGLNLPDEEVNAHLLQAS